MQEPGIIDSLEMLIATPEVAYGHTLEGFMAMDGYAMERCHDAAGVLRICSRRHFDIILLDLELSVEGDVELVSFIRERHPDTRLILLFDPDHLERALEGVRRGAFFYLPRNCPPSDVALIVEKAVKIQIATQAAEAYEQNVFEELVGHTEAMQRVIDTIRKVAPTDSTVLLLGESGTGKEVLANTIHRLSRRSEMPFIAINCAALPEALLESEMFGHVKGAFTGADRDKMGLFEEADGGTLFLDEIGDMSPITQAKLLRVLQSGEIRRVGDTAPKKVEVRVLAATNVDLVEAVRDHRFREDLYFRLNMIQVRIPPLRERMDALPTLINHFLLRANQSYDRQVLGLDDHALRVLARYEFPGNVRELESIISHGVIMADENKIREVDLPDQVRFGLSPRLALPFDAEGGIETLATLEERHIRETLHRLHNNQSLAAKKLGISRTTLWRKVKEYGIELEE